MPNSPTLKADGGRSATRKVKDLPAGPCDADTPPSLTTSCPSVAMCCANTAGDAIVPGAPLPEEEEQRRLQASSAGGATASPAWRRKVAVCATTCVRHQLRDLRVACMRCVAASPQQQLVPVWITLHLPAERGPLTHSTVHPSCCCLPCQLRPCWTARCWTPRTSSVLTPSPACWPRCSRQGRQEPSSVRQAVGRARPAWLSAVHSEASFVALPAGADLCGRAH